MRFSFGPLTHLGLCLGVDVRHNDTLDACRPPKHTKNTIKLNPNALVFTDILSLSWQIAYFQVKTTLNLRLFYLGRACGR